MRNIFFFLLLFITGATKAQLPSLSFDHLMVENGMPENYAIDICQDKNGYMWCGTQKGLMRYDGYHIKVYKQELSENNTAVNNIGSVFIDSKGIVWAGTVGNYLLRYNAQTDSFLIIKPPSIKTGIFSFITNIFEDGQNSLWLRIDNPANPGYLLQRFDVKTGNFFSFKMSSKEKADIPSDNISGICSDKEGRVWIATENGIFTYNYTANKFDGYLVSPDTSKKNVFFNLYEPPSEPGILYMSAGLVSAQTFTPEGIIRYDIAKDKATFYKHDNSNPNSLPNNVTSGFYEDSKKRFWIGTNNSLIFFDRNKNIFNSFSDGNGKPASYDHIKEDMDGNFWITCRGQAQGLTYFDPEKKIFASYYAEPDKANGLASNYIEQIFADKSGNIWLAFGDWGIERINRMRSRFTSFMYDAKDPIGYPGGFTHSFAHAKNGIYWLTTSKGLVKYDLAKGFTKIKLFNDPVKDNVIVSKILLGKDGLLWFRYHGDQLIKYDPTTGSVKSFQHRENDSTSLSNNSVTCLYEDHDSVIWVGTGEGGLCRYNKEKQNFTCYPYIHNSKVKYTGTALDDANVASIHEDKQGRLWVSTNLGGLNLLNKEKGTFTSYFDESAGLANIDGIEDADSGRLWLSSYFLGLTLFDPAKGTGVKTFSEKNGLLSGILNWLKNDKEGNLWIGSGQGISRLDPKTYSITNYTSLQGLPSNFTYPPFVDNKGEFFIGCRFGFFHFSPQDMKPNPIVPMINLESISFAHINSKNKIDTMLVSDQQQIKLKHDQNRITFYFTGIQFENSLLNTYKYKLEGYDNNWIMAGSSRYANYTNLSPGTYTFYVKAANMDGVWNDTPASIVVVIYPPWWKTWWFLITVVVVIGALFYAIIRWRFKQKFKSQLERSEKEKEVAELKQKGTELEMQALRAQMNPHFIFNSLNSINRFILQNNRAQASEYLTKFSKLVRMILQNSQASLITLESELESLELYLDLEALRFNYHFNYKISVPTEMDISALQVPPLILQPYVENAIWHGLMHKEEKGQLDVEVSEETDHLYFRITDNGIGREKAAAMASKSATKHKSMGLRITAHRIAIVQNPKTLTSPVTINDLVNADGSAAGTEVVIKLPVIYD